ncbi:hypothetical protein TWF694_008097 [Orbilia ellipsospora]|uniref:Nephrocystin 3-like N-terminal domain-containing protein n=1 Tax=Orbilia ellipsospora TaxID=2528407 RepID=A0AAV9XG23_9PEZI
MDGGAQRQNRQRSGRVYESVNASGTSRVINGDVYNYGLKLEADDAEACRSEILLTDTRDDKAGIISRFGARVQGTCDWITRDATYRKWLQDERSSLLWLSGPPATGKTTISVFLTDQLADSFESKAGRDDGSDDLVLYYFCTRQDERRSTAISILRGLIYLILLRRPHLINCMLKDFRSHKKNNSLFDPSNREALWRNFNKIIRELDFEKVYIVLDGLDECEESSLEWLLVKLKGLSSPELQPQKPILKLMIASQRHPRAIPAHLSAFLQIELFQDTIKEDLKLVIRSKILKLARKKANEEKDEVKRKSLW